jgi:hypothetical protein
VATAKNKRLERFIEEAPEEAVTITKRASKEELRARDKAQAEEDKEK